MRFCPLVSDRRRGLQQLAGVVLLLGTFGLMAGAAAAQSKGEGQHPETSRRAASDSTEGDANLLMMPTVFYTPETKFAGGVVAGYYTRFDSLSRSSSIQGASVYTQRRQFYLQLMADLYWQHGRYNVDGEVLLKRYPDVFFGIGPTVPAQQKESYTSRFIDAQVTWQRRVHAHLRIGPQVHVRHERITETKDGGLLAMHPIPGEQAGTAMGVGMLASWDSRDRRYYPHTGRYVKLSARGYSATWGSSYTYGRLRLDARQYLSLGGAHVFAARTYVEAVAGTAPFQLLPMLGGDELMRGYREGRFRDQLFATVQAEYRFPLFWRFKAAVFGSIGNVAQRLETFSFGTPKYAGGAGLRMRLNEAGVHGRIDYAFSPQGGALYVTFMEAF